MLTRVGQQFPGQRRMLARADPRGSVTVSDRPEDRPVPNLARASARNARTRTAERTDGTSTKGSIPARVTIGEDGGEDAGPSRIANGLPERIEDPAAVAALAAILRRPPSESTNHETRLGSK